MGSTNRTWLRLSAEGEQSNLHPLKINDIIKIGSTVFVVQTNDIANLKNMPVINKRLAGNFANGIINAGQLPEEEKSSQLPPHRNSKGMTPVSGANGAAGATPAGFNSDVCKICCEADADAAFIPCGHNFACVKCAWRCECCPVCRMSFEDIIKIYKN